MRLQSPSEGGKVRISPELCIIPPRVPQGRAVRALLPVLGQPFLNPWAGTASCGVPKPHSPPGSLRSSQEIPGHGGVEQDTGDFVLLGGKD